MRNPAAGFIKRLTTTDTDVDGVAAQKEPPRKPHEWRGIKAGQARTAKRIHKRNQAATNRRFQKARVAQLRQVVRDRERRAVAVLREVESRAGVAPGGLRQQLIEETKLTANESGHTPVEILAAFGIDDVAIQELYEGLVEDRLNDAELRRAKKRQAAQAKRDAITSLEASKS